MKSYDGTMLPNIWEAYIKVDGINFFCLGNTAMTRDGTEFTLPFQVKEKGHYELFEYDWGSTVSLKSQLKRCRPDNLYNLDKRDNRLFLKYMQNPNSETVEELLKYVVSKGHEGLILRQGKKMLKVKPFVTSDVRVTGIRKGTGRNEGLVGSLKTNYGNVLLQKKADKILFADGSIIGKIVEVKAMGWTADGKMRHARFLRLRDDKNTEHLERIEDKYGA